MTRAGFLDWAERQEGRHEFADGEPRAMVGASLNHDQIALNLAIALQTRLRGGPCRAFMADAGIATARDGVRYPDVLVTCTRFDGREKLAPEPVLVCEVVADSTARTDRVARLREYHATPSIRRCVLIEQTAIALNVFFREGDQPWSAIPLGEGETLELPEPGSAVPLGAIYAGVELPA